MRGVRHPMTCQCSLRHAHAGERLQGGAPRVGADATSRPLVLSRVLPTHRRRARTRRAHDATLKARKSAPWCPGSRDRPCPGRNPGCRRTRRSIAPSHRPGSRRGTRSAARAPTRRQRTLRSQPHTRSRTGCPPRQAPRRTSRAGTRGPSGTSTPAYTPRRPRMPSRRRVMRRAQRLRSGTAPMRPRSNRGSCLRRRSRTCRPASDRAGTPTPCCRARRNTQRAPPRSRPTSRSGASSRDDRWNHPYGQSPSRARGAQTAVRPAMPSRRPQGPPTAANTRSTCGGDTIA